MSRLNGRLNHAGSPPNPGHYQPVQEQYGGHLSPLYQGPLKDTSRDEYEPSCLVKTPSGSVYIPSDDYQNSSTLSYKQESDYRSPHKEDPKSMDNYNSHFGANMGIPVLPLRNNLRPTRGITSPPSSYDTSLTTDRVMPVTGARPMAFYRSKGGIPSCSWKITAILFISISVVLLGLLGFFIVRNLVPTAPSDGGCGVVLSDDTAPASEDSLVSHTPTRGKQSLATHSRVFDEVLLDRRPDLPLKFPEVIVLEKIGSDSPSSSRRMRRSVSHDVDVELRMKHNAFDLFPSSSNSTLNSSAHSFSNFSRTNKTSFPTSSISTSLSNLTKQTIFNNALKNNTFLLSTPSKYHISQKNDDHNSTSSTSSNPFNTFSYPFFQHFAASKGINYSEAIFITNRPTEDKENGKNDEEKSDSDVVYAPIIDVVEYADTDMTSLGGKQVFDEASQSFDEEYLSEDTESISDIDYVYGEDTLTNESKPILDVYELDSISDDGVASKSKIDDKRDNSALTEERADISVKEFQIIIPSFNLSQGENITGKDSASVSDENLVKKYSVFEVNNKTASKYFSKINQSVFHGKSQNSSLSNGNIMLGDDPGQYIYPDEKKNSDSSRKRDLWDLSWIYGSNSYINNLQTKSKEVTSKAYDNEDRISTLKDTTTIGVESTTSRLKDIKTSPISRSTEKNAEDPPDIVNDANPHISKRWDKGNRKREFASFVRQLPENNANSKKGGKESMKFSTKASSKKGGRRSVSLSYLREFYKRSVRSKSSNVRDHFISRFNPSRKTENFGLHGPKGGKIPHSELHFLPSKVLESMGVSERENYGGRTGKIHVVNQEKSGSSNTAVDIFPHIFEYDLKEHDDYYYDEELPWYEQYWTRNPSVEKPINKPKAVVKGVAGSKPMSSFIKLNEGKKATEDRNHLPTGLKVMALTREGFHIESPSIPNSVSLEKNPKVFGYEDDEIEIVPLKGEPTINTSKTIIKPVSAIPRKGEAHSHSKNFNVKTSNQTSRNAYVDSSEANHYSETTAARTIESVLSTTVDQSMPPSSSTSSVVLTSPHPKSAVTSTSLQSSHTSDDSFENISSTVSTPMTTDSPERGSSSHYPYDTTQELHTTLSDVVKKDLDSHHITRWEGKEEMSTRSGPDRETATVYTIKQETTSQSSTFDKKIFYDQSFTTVKQLDDYSSTDNSILEDDVRKGQSEKIDTMLKFSPKNTGENSQPLNQGSSITEVAPDREAVKLIALNGYENAQLPNRVMVNVSISTGNEAFDSEKTLAENPVYVLSISVPTSSKDTNPRISILNPHRHNSKDSEPLEVNASVAKSINGKLINVENSSSPNEIDEADSKCSCECPCKDNGVKNTANDSPSRECSSHNSNDHINSESTTAHSHSTTTAPTISSTTSSTTIPPLPHYLLFKLREHQQRPQQTIPPDGTTFKMIELGRKERHRIPPYGYWNMQFYQPQSAYVTFEVSVPRGASLGVYGRRNALPTHTSYDFIQVLSGYKVQGSGRATRSSLAPTQLETLVKYLDQGHWFLSVYNDDGDPQELSLGAEISSQFTEGCPGGCSGNGDCILGSCQCHPGYDGAACTEMKCPVLCSGNGEYKEGQCVCRPGWKGTECSVRHDECEVPDCHGNGHCVEGKCLCANGFKGEFCQNVDCPHPNCSGHGWCVNGTCICQKGWRGPACAGMDDAALQCLPDCSGKGHFDLVGQQCVCEPGWTGSECSKRICELDCGEHGQCEEEKCLCQKGWTGDRCNMLFCDPRCEEHGQCKNGTCVCMTGWNGRHCTLSGCPGMCGPHGSCVMRDVDWECYCQDGWEGADCGARLEDVCDDGVDNDGDGLMDCADAECCSEKACAHSTFCKSSADPIDILLRKQPPAVTASFFQRMRFIIEENSVQVYADVSAFNMSRASVVRGRIVSGRGSGLVGVRVSHFRPKDTGFTLSRQGGWFDLMVNGGGAVKLHFGKSQFLPLIKTVWVPWNEIVVMDTVVLTTTEIVPPPPPTMCPDHDYITLKPVVLATWKHGFQGGCAECSAILTESQVLQESLDIPGTGLYLVYHSSRALGYKSTIQLQLTPSKIPSTLRLIHLRVTIEGILFEKTFEADADIKFTYSWNRLNVYRQRVYGVTWAVVRVGYAYSNCDQVIWDTQSTQVSGHDMSVSDIGGWDVSIHHRYNFHEGILQKGDGRNMYMKQRPRILKTLIGDGHQREASCQSCEGEVQKQRLLTPASLAAAPDGSIYIADFNLIRRISPDNIVRTIVRLNETRVSYRYHLAVSPVDGAVYISDPDSHQILKVKDPDDSSNPDVNFVTFVGSGERCLPGDEIGCGDGGLARDAKLQYPKGMAVSSKGVLYFADGTNVRAVDADGIITTIIGTHRHRSHWQPLPCSGTLSVIDVNLRWPTSLAISPLDESLYVLDDHHILRLTVDGRVKVIAGRPLHCPPLNKKGPSDLAAETTLRSPQSLAFTPNGDLYIAESDTERINRIRVINTDERIHDFAGAESKCNCREEDCPCYDENHVLASTAIFSTISAVAVTPDGALHVLDQGNLRVRTIIASIPQLTRNGDYEIYSPETQELYIFNRFGHHIETRNIPTKRSLYVFIYNVNTSNGKLSSITDAAGNRINFLRDYSGQVTMIENSRQQKSRLSMSRMRQLEEIVTPDQHNVTLTYHGASGLLRSRMESTGIAHVYSYDDYGRLTRIVTPSGQIIDLSFDLSEEGALVTVTRDGTSPVTMLIKGTIVTETIGSASSVTAQLADGSVITRNPWGHHIATETVAYSLLENHVLANTFPIHGRQRTEINNELVNSFDWKYFINQGERDKSTVKQMGRRMRVNGEDLLTLKYDLFSGTEAVISETGETILNVTYDDLGRPLHWTPTPPYAAVSLSYDRYGLLQEWKWGQLREDYLYDLAGRFEGIAYADKSKFTYSYRDISSIKPYKVSVDRGMEHLLEYDDGGALSAITTPRGHKYVFQIQPSVLHNRFIFISPISPRHPFQILYSDSGKLLSTVLPHQAGRVIYNYDEAGRVHHLIFGDGSVEYGYQPETGLIRSVTLRELAYEQRIDNKYHAGLLKERHLRFGPAVPHHAAKMRYLYDGNARPRRVEVEINGRQLPNYDLKYNMIRGTLEAMNDLKITKPSYNKTVIQNSRKSMIRVTTYDSHGQIGEESLTINGRFVHRMSYLYDLRGRLASKTIWRGPESIEFQTNYTYTPDGFLMSVEGTESWQFRYDANGNMISVAQTGREISASYDVSDRLVDWGEDKLNIYDAAGRVIQQGDFHFSYTARGNIRYAWKQNKVRITYRYDHRSRLTSWEDHNGSVTQFFYVDQRRPYLVTHIHYPNTEITHTILYDDNDRIISIQTESGQYWINTDITGTPVSVYDSSGVLFKEIIRSPWGEVLQDSNDKLILPIDFFGSIKDPITGLCIFHMHPYDPKHGQWMAPRYDRISNSPEHVTSIYLHRFQDNDPVNRKEENENHYTGTHNWLRLFGIDLKRMLGSNYHDETLDSPSKDLEIPGINPSLKIISGLSCSKRSIFKSFSRPSLLPESLVQIDEPRLAVSSWNLLNKFSSSGPVLGPGVLISKVNDKTLVTLVPHRENSVVQAVARDVLNGSALLDVTLPHHKRHTLYLVKEDINTKAEDLTQLLRLSGIFNVTHHDGDHPEIRVVGSTTSLVLIYGSTPEAARHRLLRHVHHKAAEHAWLAEKRLLENSGPSLHPWTPEEKTLLLRDGKVPGYVAAELHSVHRFPLLADDASNVVFRKDVDRRRRRRTKFQQYS